MKEFLNITSDQERALYGISDALVKNCVFAGEADGESALKETSGLKVEFCDFHLRYPHVNPIRQLASVNLNAYF